MTWVLTITLFSVMAGEVASRPSHEPPVSFATQAACEAEAAARNAVYESQKQAAKVAQPDRYGYSQALCRPVQP
jgi:hypothetical protein